MTSRLINDCLEKRKKIDFIEKIPSKLLLLEFLETYDLRFYGENWNELKKAFSLSFLLPTARKYANSWYWLKRNFAARVFALTPLLQDEPLIVDLIDDPSFLVRSIATAAAMRLQSKKGVVRTIRNMSQEPGYAHYYYSDILSQGSNLVFSWVVEIASRQDALHLTCLEILAHKIVPVPIPFLQKDLKSNKTGIRQAALKIAIRNTEEGSVKLFTNCLKDKNQTIQILGAKGLGNYPSKNSYIALKRGAADLSWNVRVECARSLNKLGKINLLKDRALVQYVLEFG